MDQRPLQMHHVANQHKPTVCFLYKLNLDALHVCTACRACATIMGSWAAPEQKGTKL